MSGVEEQFIHMVNVTLPFTTYLYSMGKVELATNDTKTILFNGDSVLIRKGEVISLRVDNLDVSSLSETLRSMQISTSQISLFNKFRLSLPNNASIKQYALKNAKPVNNVIYRGEAFSFVDKEKINFIINMMESESICKELSVLEHPFMSSSLLNILCNQNSEAQYILNSSYSLQLSEAVAAVVIKDYSVNWTIEKLSNHFNTSTSTFKKKMNKEIGCTSTFIREIKMTEALRLLKRTNLSISDISSSLGFCNQAYFCFVFRSFFGRTPMEVKKNRAATPY